MTGFLGSDLLVKIGDGASPTEAFAQFAALRNSSLSLGGAPVDQTTADDKDVNGNIWQTVIAGPKSFSISADGVAKTANKSQVQQVLDDFTNNTPRNYEVTVPVFGVFVVSIVVTNFEITAQYDDVITFSITLQANGAPAFTPEA
ncbi:MAG: phage tail tube protein [Pseudomonadota bacterium]